MRPVSVGEAHPVIAGQFEAAAQVCIGHYLGTGYSLRVELVVPRRVERVGPVDAFAVAADLDHLRTACIGVAVRVGRAAYNAADAHRSGKLRLSGIADIVLPHL